jgi:hypothetical protein
MNSKIKIILIVFLFGNLKLFSKSIDIVATSVDSHISSNARVINTSDSIIFDLANATLTATYLDLPIYIKSDDVVLGIDYALKFNLSKLSYSIAIDILAESSAAFFNPTDLFLRYSGGSPMSGLPSSGNIYVTKIRFALSAPCTAISAADFTNISTLINGVACSYRVTSLNFAQFIPNANFNNDPACLNTLMQFSDVSTVSSGAVNSWSWNFGNGTVSDLQNNLTTYTATGTVSATLIVGANTGCGDTITKSFTVNQAPISSFSYLYNCVKDSVFFTNLSSVSSGTITSSSWYFGDFTGITNLKNPKHRYASSGFYKVKLTSSTNSQCSSVKTLVVALRPSDINRDGITDVNDFLLFVPAWLSVCN